MFYVFAYRADNRDHFDDAPWKAIDPDAAMPDVWDEDEDGPWQAPTIDNPNFSSAHLSDASTAARTIATAHGPSGANRDYLTQLAAWLEKVGERDEHVEELMRRLPPATRLGRH